MDYNKIYFDSYANIMKTIEVKVYHIMYLTRICSFVSRTMNLWKSPSQCGHSLLKHRAHQP